MSNSTRQMHPPKAAVDQAIGLYNQGQLKKTILVAERLAERYPNALVLYELLGAAYMGLDNKDKTIESYQKALRLNPKHTDAYNNMGLALYDKGMFTEAVESYKKAVQFEPRFSDAHYNLGNALKQTGDLKQAIESYKASLAINPNDAEILLNYGSALNSCGEFDQAIEIYVKALTINPNSVTVQKNMDNAVKKKAEIDKLVADYAKISKLEIDSAEIASFTGTLLKARGYLHAAIDSYKKATKIKPDYAEAYLSMGDTLRDRGDLDEAIECYLQALEIKPDYATVYNNLGIILKSKGDVDEAIESYKKAIKFQPENAIIYYNMGNALKDNGDLGGAIENYNKAIKLQPEYAIAYSNMGTSLKDQGNLVAAINTFERVLKINPDYATAHHNLSFAFLNIGRLKEGLDEYEWRWRTDNLLSKQRHFSKPIWDGLGKLKGKRILIWGEQGPQDMIIWSSCLPYLSSCAGHCILECPKKLVALFARSFPKIEVKVEDRSADEERNDFDFHLPMGSLFRHFISKISKNVKTNAFLVPDPIKVALWKKRLNSIGKGPFVGISWKSPLITPQRLPNYTQISDWAPVFALEKLTFINLQSTEFTDDLNIIQEEFGVTVHNFDYLDHYNNLDEVAALCTALDIVVSVSTAVSAIAAAAGTPIKLAAWRQSPWNNILLSPRGPSVDIFERSTWEPWDNVFQSIAKDIKNIKQ